MNSTDYCWNLISQALAWRIVKPWSHAGLFPSLGSISGVGGLSGALPVCGDPWDAGVTGVKVAGSVLAALEGGSPECSSRLRTGVATGAPTPVWSCPKVIPTDELLVCSFLIGSFAETVERVSKTNAPKKVQSQGSLAQSSSTEFFFGSLSLYPQETPSHWKWASAANEDFTGRVSSSDGSFSPAASRFGRVLDVMGQGANFEACAGVPFNSFSCRSSSCSGKNIKTSR